MSAYTENKNNASISLHTKVVSDKAMRPSFAFEVVVHTKDKNLTFADGIFVFDLTITRDYEKNVGDYIEVKLSVPMGTFLEDIYPFMDNCEVTLRVKKQFTVSGKGLNAVPVISVNRYKAVYLKDKNKNLPNTKTQTKSDMNQMLPGMVTLQLIDRAVEAVRIKTTGGNIAIGGRVADVAVRSILSAEINRILIEGKPALDTVTVLPADSTTKVEALALPSYTRIVEIPDYIQEKSIGLFNTGLGCYIQRYMSSETGYKTGIWVYPLYKVKKASAKEIKLIAIENTAITSAVPALVPNNDGYSGLCAKPTVQETSKDAKVMSQGSGFRVADATKMMTKPITVTKMGPVYDRSKLNTEVVYKEREDCVNFAVNKGVFYNNLAMASGVSKDNANFLTIELANIDHDTIRPAMNLTVLSDLYDAAQPVGGSKNIGIRYDCNILQMVVSYTNNRHNVIFSNNSKYTELTSHAVIRACYEVATSAKA